MADKEKRVRYSEGYVNGEVLAIKNGAITNKGKKDNDKRDDIRDREWKLDKARIMKHANR